MKKLYQGKGRRVHPAPPPAPDAALALLPAALLALAATLTAEEQEVLAYLLSGIGTGGSGPAGGRRSSKRQGGPHQPEMGCGCFGCYKSYWARWDASPNRHLIHRIIEAVEEGTAGGAPAGGASGATRRGGHRRRRRGRGGGRDLDSSPASGAVEADAGLLHQVCCASDGGEDRDYEGDEDDGADSVYGGGDGEEEEAMTDDSDCASSGNAEKSAVGKLVRFIGEKVWGAWN
uniref:Uncharacterized protein n=1 Tax=Avena sativa TaxID=4498 RepID=A0ACD5YZU8_AVESA